MKNILRAEIDEIIKNALSGGGQFAEIYFQESDATGISYIGGKVESASSGTGTGCGIRLIKDDNTFYASQSCPTVKTMIELSKEIAGAPSACGAAPSQNPVRLSGFSPVPELDIYIKKMEELDAFFRKQSGRIRQVSFRISTGRTNFFVANSDGVYAADSRFSSIFVASFAVTDGSITQSSHEVAVAGPLSGITPEKISDIAATAYKRASDLLDIAVPAPAGEMAVVISSSAGGTMIHEAIGHSLEADAVQKDISPVYKGRLGKKVAADIITVVDDPTISGLRGSYKFDDEGTPSQRTILVENGVLKNYLYDLYTARKDGVKSTGNGRRESYQAKPIPRMSNTFIAPGADDPEKILASVSKGVFVKKMGGGQVNTANGDFIFEVEEGYEITGGKPGRMLRNASLIGNGPEILNSIDMVGNDIGWQPGTCGKDGQGVPVTDGQPTLRIPKITVGGTG